MKAGMKLFIVTMLGLFVLCPATSAAWTEPVPVTEVNTQYEEWAPFLSFDKLSLYFARVRTNISYYGRIYEARRENPSGPFTSIREISELNEPLVHILCPWVSPDNLRMYYYKEQGAIGVWSLQVSERSSVNDPWPKGTGISELNALGNALLAPKLTADELIIFFSAYNLPGGQGEYDIWMATRPDRNSPFGQVRNLSEINTTSYELYPSPSADGLQLYFTSNRNGNYQLFKATRESLDAPFGNVEHLSFLDTPGGHSLFPYLSSDGSKLYFVRQVGENLSSRDIWVQDTKPQPIEGLISRWEFDEGSGTTAYDSVGSNHGIIHGAQWTSGIIGSALNFDGINDYVEVPDNESQQIKTNQLTVTGWIKLDEDIGNRQRRLICKQQTTMVCWGLEVYGNGYCGATGNQVLFHDSNGSTFSICLSTTKLALHKWYHIAATDTAGAIRIYLDGQLDHSCEGGYGIPPNINAPILIGRTNPPALFFKDMVDDVMIFDRALSAEEIQQIYQAVVPPVEIPETYYVDGVNGNDSNDGLSLETAFATVQKGINTAKDGNTVLVYPAVYSEAVNFAGKAIMVQGVATTTGIPVLEKVGDFAVSFYNGEGPGSILKDFVIRNSFMAVFISGCSPTISNVTVVDNKYGISAYTGAGPDISNCIFWNNTDADLDGCQARYSWVQDTKPQPLEGLISRWAFDEGSGTIAHDSVGNNHGTIYGAQWTTGILGGALDFAGNGERVEVPDDDSLTPANQITICFWVYNRGGSVPAIYKSASCPGEPASPGNSRAYGMALSEEWVSMSVYSAVNTYGQITSNNPVSLNKWHHVAGTFNQGQAALYVDGHPEISATLAVSSIMNDAQPLIIGGAWEYCGTDSFEGKLNGVVDDVRIYNRALSAEEIRQLYQNGSGVSPLFADPANGDYHLLSRRGRYWPQHDVWVLDKVTSPCVDGGDPAVDPSGEPMPNGGRIDMGAYGGTPFASMSEWPLTTDTNRDGAVDLADLATFCNEWLSTLPWAE